VRIRQYVAHPHLARDLPKQAGDEVKWHVGSMGFAVRRENGHAALASDTGGLVHQAALAGAWRTRESDHRAPAVDRPVDDHRDGVQFPLPANETGSGSDIVTLAGHREQPVRTHRFGDTLDADLFWFGQIGEVCHQAGGGFR
jgi:hypothetical protein